ncbi:ABC transporter ATP-binding protein [Saccharothrix australiensis]|uniref:ABC-type multidrug transport system ATPase subunit n=1 Tax=Saccharothrix australiensis TaxID=2072 RepID=A0A495W393_9PSEU|nr:ABC transporter ATP-binding protein [Saccharothrix australiensis]RKT55153.1 ABC-type multidrug transport system ATPase subunit [Saccharothrix australiensis]
MNSPRVAEPPALQVRDLRKQFGRRHVLNGVDLDLPSGALVGVVGENGAGKSTLLRILAGELKPSGGSVRRSGSIGYCPQKSILNEALTIDQHLRLFQAAYRLPTVTRALELVERLNFAEYRRTPVRFLSGGTRQKLNLTLALMHDPAVLLLDEPYQGFDWETYLRFWEIAADLHARDRTIVVISHLVHDRERFDSVHHLKSGVIEQTSVESEAS